MQEIAFTALVHGVYVVTTRLEDVVNGMTASWVSQVSLKPLLVMVSIAPSRYSHRLIQESGIFAVNVLDSTQADLGKRFGYKSGRQVDKFAGLEWTTRGHRRPHPAPGLRLPGSEAEGHLYRRRPYPVPGRGGGCQDPAPPSASAGL